MFRRGRKAVEPADVVIVGAGVGGLMTALALGRAGVATTVVERDHLADHPDVESAFAEPRRGTPQVRQTHGFLSRLALVLRHEFPDVLADLEAAGGRPLSMTGHLGAPEPSDEDLAVLVVRRSTFEWILRARARQEPNVSIRSGVGVRALVASDTHASGRPMVSGVYLEDGSTLVARAVVAGTGARGEVVRWLAEIGVECPERNQSIGLTYMTRWYRRPAGDVEPRLLAHLPYMKVLAVPGDGETISVTLAVQLGDTELRRALADPVAFDRTCRLLYATADLFSGDHPMEPLSGVEPMAGLSNRARRFTDAQGQPNVIGFHAVGDAHTMTNPLLGRGCTLATIQAVLLADAFRCHPDDPAARAVGYERACEEQTRPWLEDAFVMAAFEAGQDPSSLVGHAAVQAAQLVGTMSASRDDPVLGRALARYVNLMETPTEFLGRDEVLARVEELSQPALQAPDPTLFGPSRDDLLSHLGVRSPGG